MPQSLRGAVDADRFSPAARRQDARLHSEARAARNRILDTCHEVETPIPIKANQPVTLPAEIVALFFEKGGAAGASPSMTTEDERPRIVEGELLRVEIYEVASAVRVHVDTTHPDGYTVRMPPGPMNVYDADDNPGGVWLFEDREKWAIESYGARSREQLRPERMIDEHGEEAILLLLIATLQAGAANP